MQCSVCGKSDKVTIGSNDYCSNCGAQVRQATAAVKMTDIRPPSSPPIAGAFQPVVAPTAPVPPPPVAPVIIPAAPKPVVTAPAGPPKPSFFKRLFGKKAPKIAAVATPVATQPNPAEQFHKPSGVAPTPVPTPAPVPTTPAPTPVIPQTTPVVPLQRIEERHSLAQSIAQSGLISKFHKSPEPAVATPTPAPATPVAPIMSMSAAAKLITPAAPEPTPAKASHALSVAAAVASIAIMAGYIWISNYPKLIAKTAGTKAGFNATTPGYLPASFSLSGPVAYSPGEVSFNFAGPGGNLALIQRKSNWDSNTLLDNYVSRKSDKYLAIQGQGLTIYVYNGNQASWVNRGIWFALEGDSKLNRDQILKIAYSL